METEKNVSLGVGTIYCIPQTFKDLIFSKSRSEKYNENVYFSLWGNRATTRTHILNYTFFNVLVAHSESRTAYYTRRTIHVSLRFILLYREMDFGWFGFYKYQCCKLPPCNICVKFEVIFGVPFLKGKKFKRFWRISKTAWLLLCNDSQYIARLNIKETLWSSVSLQN